MSVEKLRKRRTINTQLSHTDWQRKCLQEQVICHGKANQKYRLILVFKPFLLVSMIQRLSKSWEIQQLLEIMDFVPRL